MGYPEMVIVSVVLNLCWGEGLVEDIMEGVGSNFTFTFDSVMLISLFSMLLEYRPCTMKRGVAD
jgi:hypothetical protein